MCALEGALFLEYGPRPVAKFLRAKTLFIVANSGCIGRRVKATRDGNIPTVTLERTQQHHHDFLDAFFRKHLGRIDAGLEAVTLHSKRVVDVAPCITETIPGAGALRSMDSPHGLAPDAIVGITVDHERIAPFRVTDWVIRRHDVQIPATV